jgi:hypothetical protein
LGLALGLLLALSSRAPAQAPVDSGAGVGTLSRDVAMQEDGDPAVIPEPVVQAIRRGQEALRARCNNPNKLYFFHQTGSVALGTLALMVDGSVPGRGPYGREVAMGVDFLLKSAQPTGLIYVNGGGTPQMYNHALATLCLAEVWGMTSQPEILPVLKRAVDLIVRCQGVRGSWRYEPKPVDGDISVTVMQVVALRAAQNSGILVPEQTIRDAIRFVKSVSCGEKELGFGYYNAGTPLLPRSAAGVISLQLCGEYEAVETRRGLQYLQQQAKKFDGDVPNYFYAQYYAMQAMYQARDSKQWNAWYTAQCKNILARQAPNGEIGGGIDTSFAILALGLPYRFLPIYQR